MKCREFQNSISELIDGRTDEYKSAVLLQHAQTCKYCGDILHYTQQMKRSLNAMGGHQIPVDCWSVVSARIASIHRRITWQAVALKYALAPSVAALFLAGYFLLAPNDNTSQYTAIKAQPVFTDYMNIHGSAGADQPFSDSDTYFIAAGMQDSGVR